MLVGQGMQRRMDDLQDHPVYGHELGHNEDGSHFERCWGTRGLYISSNASGQWENVGPFWGRRTGRRPILTSGGVDIRDLLVQASAAAGIPPELLLGCIAAESELDPHAERWGLLTPQAKTAIQANDRAALRSIIAQAGSDISFGLAQRIVKFHYFGNHESTVENVLAVRQYVFDHMERDVREAAMFLKTKLVEARQGDLALCDQDELLGACIAYNCGHFPLASEAYWGQRGPTIARYRAKLGEARAALQA